MEELFKQLTVWLAIAMEGAAALVIGLAVIRALRLFVPGLHIDVDANGRQEAKEQVRLRLGRWLAVALEFELAADVLRTAVAPTWNEIGQLAAIAILRTLLNYFLQQEIDKAERRQRRSGETAAGDMRLLLLQLPPMHRFPLLLRPAHDRTRSH